MRIIFSLKHWVNLISWEIITEAKKVFLEISQNSQENTCASSFLIKLQVSGKVQVSCNFIKRETLAQVFSC